MSEAISGTYRARCPACRYAHAGHVVVLRASRTITPNKRPVRPSHGLRDRHTPLRRPVPPEQGKGFSGERGEHETDHVIEAFILGVLRQEVAAEDHAQGSAV